MRSIRKYGQCESLHTNPVAEQNRNFLLGNLSKNIIDLTILRKNNIAVVVTNIIGCCKLNTSIPLQDLYRA